MCNKQCHTLHVGLKGPGKYGQLLGGPKPLLQEKGDELEGLNVFWPKPAAAEEQHYSRGAAD